MGLDGKIYPTSSQGFEDSRKDGFPRSPLGNLKDQTGRFLAKILFGDDCWEWVGLKSKKGYGRFGRQFAHRIAYKLFVGPITGGLVIDHLCRNHSCVSPDHLELVTQKENTLRGSNFIARQSLQRSCKRGHPFNNTNTRIYRGKRICRKCHVFRNSSYGRGEAVHA